jgi:hypothetical protein
VALLARFACGCKLRVEIPAPSVVRCVDHDAEAELITMPNGQVRYMPRQDEAPRDSGNRS